MRPSEIRIGNRVFSLSPDLPYIMGILNVTPDSFSDGGRWVTLDLILRHAEDMIREGVDIIDVGCESTRPGYRILPAAVEAEKVSDVVAALRERFDIPISVDTYKPEVFLEAAEAGADMLNDIWGLRCPEKILRAAVCRPDLTMAEVLKETGAPAVLMHQDLLARSADERTEENIAEAGLMEAELSDVLLRVRGGWLDSLLVAEKAGISSDRILLDPGVGFSKTQEENLLCIAAIDKLIAKADEMGSGVLLGVSRKSVIGNVLEADEKSGGPGSVPPAERDDGTVATSVYAADRGVRFLRVHNVKANREALLVWEALRRAI